MAYLNTLQIDKTIYDLAAKFDSDGKSISETYSTKEEVTKKLADLVDSAPETLDTLNELAKALGEDPNFATTIATKLGLKVDKEDGKGLSTEDFTTALKELLEGIPDTVDAKYTKPSTGVPKTDLASDVQASLNKADSAIQDISSKLDVSTYNTDKTTFALRTEIPTTLPASDVSAWAKATTKPTYTAAEVGLSKVDNTADADKPISTAAQTALDTKVDKEDGKGLSANDYTTVEKTKLAGIAENANNYSLPTASNSVLGGIKVGDNLSISDGVLSGAYEEATETTSGLMSKEDKVKLSSIETTVEGILGVEDLLSYGIQFDSTIADPTCVRIGNPLLHKSLPIQSAYKGCIVKDGVLQYYLDPNDWSKRADGTDAVLDGTDGDVCIETPIFYLKCITKGTVTTVRESLVQIDSSYKKVNGLYVDAYRGTVNDSKFRSVVNTSTDFRGGNNNSSYDTYLESDPFRTHLGKPRTSASRAMFRTWARNAGKELLSYDQYKAIFYWNYVIEYANFNSQAAYNAELTSDGYRQGGLGNGITTWDWNSWSNYNGNNPLTPCGYGNALGNGTGVIDLIIPEYTYSTDSTGASKTFQMPRWRGFDNPFGDIWTNLDGIILNNYNLYIIQNKDDYTDSLTNLKYNRMYSDIPQSSGWIKSMELGENADFVPKTIGGSATTYMCDYYWISSNTNTLLVGGVANNGSHAGLGDFDAYFGVSLAYAYIGARSVWIRN